MKGGERMDVTLSVKIPIRFKSANDSLTMSKTTEIFRDACQYVSDYIFYNEFVLNVTAVHRAIYYDLRSKYQLRSQMAASAIRNVIAQYKTVQTQLRKQRIVSNSTGCKRKYITKDLNFLEKPISFKRPQLDLVRQRDYGWKNEFKILSLNTLSGRILVDSQIKGQESYFDKSWKIGTGKVFRSGRKWYFIISVTKEFPDADNFENVVGIDRGLRQIITTYDNKGNTHFVNGDVIKQKRRHYKKLRALLQAKGTRAAKRKLKTIGRRESRWMNDVNHCLSKALVDKYGAHTLFVLEDLTGITFETTKHRKKDNRYEHHSWAFFDFEQKLTYKANCRQSKVITVSAKYTSQRCSKCGKVDKLNRHREFHEYTCNQCGYRSNDDRIAAMNIYELGVRFMNGDTKPQFKKD